MPGMGFEDQIAEELLAKAGGRIHLMGVAGVGMAGLAALLQRMGFAVSGCDLKDSSFSDWAVREGVDVLAGHSPSHIEAGMVAVIRSTAVPADHPELLAAQSRGIPVLRRGAVLAAIVNTRRSVAIAGTHGKTTTAAMLAQVLRAAGRDAGFFVGAMVDGLRGISGYGEDLFVAEADESDGTLADYCPDYAILTNADLDHLEHYAGLDSLWTCFRDFVRRTRKTVIYNHDDERARKMAAAAGKSLGYGFSEGAEIRGSEYRQSADACEFKLSRTGAPDRRVRLPVPGMYNASNALAVCALCVEIGLDPNDFARQIMKYRAPRRRFEHIGRVDGVEVYMDYSHHPTEIRALLQSVSEMGFNRLIAIFQPHRYTRTLALGAEFPAAFHGVDHLLLAPVFAASEQPMAGGRSSDLMQFFQGKPQIAAVLADDLADAWSRARRLSRPGDLLLLIGAGDIEQISDWIRSD